MHTPKHILVIRFSAMGDVAMTIPVIHQVLQQHPMLQITVASAAHLEPLFSGLERCHFHPAFFKGKHMGIGGLYRLFKELKGLAAYDAVVVDLHSVLRSHFLSACFSVSGTRSFSVDKGRAEKKALTRREDKVLVPLTPMHERYAVVFRKAGLAVELTGSTVVYERKALPGAITNVFLLGKKVVGVAPFARYTEKMYPIDRMKKVVEALSAANNTVLLFGGGNLEETILQQWEQDIFSVFNIAGRYSLGEELSIISNLDYMISMDSANMHLASLFNVPVLSVWGATHPYAGFYGWAQDVNNIVQTDLYCRPCSVFGNKPCYRGDHACMNSIDGELILQKINTLNPPSGKAD